MTTDTTLTVYLLGQRPGRVMSFAPHGWKTVLPLRYLGVAHRVVLVTLAELREVLPQQLGLPKVTLPTLIVESGNDKEIIMDSYRIAQWLEARYGGERTLFEGEAGRQYGRFLENWVDRSLAAEIRPCVLHTSYSFFPTEGETADVASKKAFLAKCGQARMDELTALNGDPAWAASQYAAVRRELGTMEVLLREGEEDGKQARFLGGGKPTHADFCVYAFYPYSRTNAELVRETWHHESLPHVQRWLQAMQDVGLVKESELLPI